MRSKADRFRLAVRCFVTFVVIGLGALAAFTVRSGTPVSPGSVSSSTLTPATSGAAAQVQGVSAVGRLSIERITITPNGFEPTVITRGPGPFLLAVDNRSGLDDLALRLDGLTGRLRTQQASRSKASWREIVELVPGSYTLTEPSQPQWLCRITIAVQ